MINLEYIQESIIKVLNENHTDGIFIKNFNIKNKPPYPYTTVNVLTPYMAESENNRPNLVQEFDKTKDKIIYTRQEMPQMTLSFNTFSDKENIAQQICMDTIASFKFALYDELASYGIITLEVTNPRNITGILEVDYEYRFTFDVRIRVDSSISKEIDYTKKVTITDENNNKDIIINE